MPFRLLTLVLWTSLSASAVEVRVQWAAIERLAAETERMLESPGNLPAYTREVRKFTVPEIRVTVDALIVVVDFELTVK